MAETPEIVWTGENGREVADFLLEHGATFAGGGHPGDGWPVVPRIGMPGPGYSGSQASVVFAEPGDTIVRFGPGEFSVRRACPGCDGDGRDHGLQEPERSQNPCPECEGAGAERP